MNKKFLLKWVPVVLMIFFLQACGNTDKVAGDNEGSKSKQEVETYTVTDDVGEEITFEKEPEKIISLQPSTTEILFELGVGDTLIGVTDYDVYPEEAKEIERVSDLVNVNEEKIISLKPDIVFVYTLSDKESLNSIKDAGIDVFVIDDAFSFDDVYENIEKLAKIMDVEEKGEQLVNQISGDIEALEEKLSNIEEKKQAYVEISPAPDIVTTGSTTFQNEVLKTAGVENIFADTEGWLQISEEEVVKRNPEVIITQVNFLEDSVGEIKGRIGWDELDAVKNDQVFELDTNLMSRPGPRIAEAAELIAKTVYPELFEVTGTNKKQ